MKKIKTILFSDITAIPAALQASYYPALDGLRGLAILLVLFPHFGFNYLVKANSAYVDSNIGVHIFFVLSGFLITTLLLKEKLRNGSISLKYFYIRRVLRILPVAYLFLLVLITLNIYYHLNIPAFDFLASFLFFKNLPMRNEPFTAHLWTLAAEEQFYIIFPFLLATNINRYFMIALAIIIIVPLISVLGFYQVGFLFANPTISLLTKGIMYMFWKGPVIILIGSVFAILAFKGIVKIEYVKKSYFLAFILLAMAIIVHTRASLLYTKYISDYLSAVLIALAILFMLGSRNFLSVILQNGILIRTGILSYSLYIWQELFIGTGIWQPWLQFMHAYPLYLVFIIKLVITFAIAILSYYLFESKFLRLKAKFDRFKR